MLQGFLSIFMVAIFLVGCEHTPSPVSTSASQQQASKADIIVLPTPDASLEDAMKEGADEEVDAAKQEVLDYQNNPVEKIEENDPNFDPLPPARPQAPGCDGLFCP